MEPNTTTPIFATGASGYLASHLIKLLLENGYKVRGTAKYQFLYDPVPEKNDNLELVEANLSEKACWSTAVEGCEYVFHVASPVPNNLKKVVMTSSCQAIYFGNEGKTVPEEDLSVEEKCPAYPKSKLKAERAAWKFYDEEHKDKIEMPVVKPTLILGPVYTNHGNSSETLLAEILNEAFPGIMDVILNIVDVRDAAECHYRAMFTEDGDNFAAQEGVW